MDYETVPGEFSLPSGEGQYGAFQYLNSRGWPLLEPGGRALDDFILSHDPALAHHIQTHYYEAPYGGCDENGCSVWDTIPAWRSVNYQRAQSEGVNARILLTRAEYALLTSIGQQAPPTEYEYGSPLAPFAPISWAPAPLPSDDPGPIRLPPVFEPPELFPTQAAQPGPGNTAAPATPTAPANPGPLLTVPNLDPAPAAGGAVLARLAIAAAAALLFSR